VLTIDRKVDREIEERYYGEVFRKLIRIIGREDKLEEEIVFQGKQSRDYYGSDNRKN